MKNTIASTKQITQKGFTIIELMMVVAVIAVLAAFALPAYQDYSIRTRVAEGLALASSAKTAMADYYTSNKAWPANNSVAGMAAPSAITGKSVDTVEVVDNKITVTYKTNVGDTGKNQVVFAVPSAPAAGESITWDCSTTAGTNVDTKFLPLECR